MREGTAPDFDTLEQLALAAFGDPERAKAIKLAAYARWQTEQLSQGK